MRLWHRIALPYSLAIAVAGCAVPPPPTGTFTQIDPNSGVNVWAEAEVTAGDFSDASIITAVDTLTRTLAADMLAGKVRPGPMVKYVQVLVFVKTAADPHQKLGLVRFPLGLFVGTGGALDSADLVQLRGYGAGKNFCDAVENSSREFCRRAANDWT